jgi:hypothetical protein
MLRGGVARAAARRIRSRTAGSAGSPAEGAAELIALKGGRSPSAKKFLESSASSRWNSKTGAAHLVGARLGDGAHHAPGGAPEFRAVAVRLHAEFLHRVDAEQDAEEAGRRLVGDVGDVGAVHQVAGLLGTRAADGELCRTEAAGEVLRGAAAGDDAGCASPAA